jgi:DNA-binding GntR family transcriptional regulator
MTSPAVASLAPQGPLERPDSLADQTYAALRRALIVGTLAPGEKLTVRGVAQTFGVSLTPAREAIGRLVTERGLENGPNRTVRVPVLGRSRYRELVAIRLALEGLAAQQAFAHRDASSLRSRLEAAQAAMVAALDDGDRHTVLLRNEEFHFTLYRAARMHTLVAIIESLWMQVGPSLNYLAPGYHRTRKGAANHVTILRALAGDDVAAFRSAVEHDLLEGAAYLEQMLDDDTAAQA